MLHFKGLKYTESKWYVVVIWETILNIVEAKSREKEFLQNHTQCLHLLLLIKISYLHLPVITSLMKVRNSLQPSDWNYFTDASFHCPWTTHYSWNSFQYSFCYFVKKEHRWLAYLQKYDIQLGTFLFGYKKRLLILLTLIILVSLTLTNSKKIRGVQVHKHLSLVEENFREDVSSSQPCSLLHPKLEIWSTKQSQISRKTCKVKIKTHLFFIHMRNRGENKHANIVRIKAKWRRKFHERLCEYDTVSLIFLFRGGDFSVKTWLRWWNSF